MEKMLHLMETHGTFDFNTTNNSSSARSLDNHAKFENIGKLESILSNKYHLVLLSLLIVSLV